MKRFEIQQGLIGEIAVVGEGVEFTNRRIAVTWKEDDRREVEVAASMPAFRDKNPNVTVRYLD